MTPSVFAGRIAFEGQKPNWALFTRNAPFIYNEITFVADADGRDTLNHVRISVDKDWRQDGTTSGAWYFNEVSIFKKDSSNNYVLQQVFPLGGGAGMLQPFIFSVPSGQWDNPAPQPDTQNVP